MGRIGKNVYCAMLFVPQYITVCYVEVRSNFINTQEICLSKHYVPSVSIRILNRLEQHVCTLRLVENKDACGHFCHLENICTAFHAVSNAGISRVLLHHHPRTFIPVDYILFLSSTTISLNCPADISLLATSILAGPASQSGRLRKQAENVQGASVREVN